MSYLGSFPLRCLLYYLLYVISWSYECSSVNAVERSQKRRRRKAGDMYIFFNLQHLSFIGSSFSFLRTCLPVASPIFLLISALLFHLPSYILVAGTRPIRGPADCAQFGKWACKAHFAACTVRTRESFGWQGPSHRLCGVLSGPAAAGHQRVLFAARTARLKPLRLCDSPVGDWFACCVATGTIYLPILLSFDYRDSTTSPETSGIQRRKARKLRKKMKSPY